MARQVIHVPQQQPSDDHPLMSARQTLAMYQNAIARRWELPPDTRKKIYEFATAVLADPEQPVRARVNASKVLASLDATQSAESRAMVELTLRFDLASAEIEGTSDALAGLEPPDPDEPMTSDEPHWG
jgi:hypothetical protein